MWRGSVLTYVGACRFLVLGASLQFWKCTRYFDCFYEILCHTIGLESSDVTTDSCPFNIQAVFMTVAAIERRASICFHFFWEAMCGKYFVEVWGNCMGPSSGGKLSPWVLVRIDLLPLVNVLRWWSREIHVNLLPQAVWKGCWFKWVPCKVVCCG